MDEQVSGYVAVVGAGVDGDVEASLLVAAEEVGALLARRGVVVVTGGWDVGDRRRPAGRRSGRGGGAGARRDAVNKTLNCCN